MIDPLDCNTRDVIRVFPRRTRWTPPDDLAFCGPPPFYAPRDRKVFVSVTFTWDLPRARRLFELWKHYYDDVSLGGPALGDVGGQFIPGLFLKYGAVVTSRGCIRKCPWCLVPEREGGIRELEIKDGWDVIDNNLLACSREHIEAVFDMLERQPESIRFSGGLDSRLFKPWHVERLKKLRLKYMWFAHDYPGAEKPLQKVSELLSDFGIGKKRCYVLIGYNNESMQEARSVLERVYKMGFLPFAMLYRPPDESRRCDQWSRDWIEFQTIWMQPRIYRGLLKQRS